MNISTIHSFALKLLKFFGIGEGFTKGLTIRSYKYEKKERLKDILNEETDVTQSVVSQLGVPFYRANKMIEDFWKKFSQFGISRDEIASMDWGKPIDTGSQAFHQVMSGIVEKLDNGYFEVKRKNEAIGLDDIMRDLQEILTINSKGIVQQKR